MTSPDAIRCSGSETYSRPCMTGYFQEGTESDCTELSMSTADESMITNQSANQARAPRPGSRSCGRRYEERYAIRPRPPAAFPM